MSKDLHDALDFLNNGHNNNPQVRENYVKAPFGWPGGKSKSVKNIIPLLPIRDTYVEHCGGSGAILLAREESELEVFNDRFSGVTDFYKIIQNPKTRDDLIERMNPTIHSRELFMHCKDTWENTQDPVERALKWYYMVVCSFGGQARNFGRSTAGINIVAIKLQKKISLIGEVSRRISHVLFENQDMFQSMTDFDGPDTVHYFDPPYVKYAKGAYDYEMNREQHYQLCNRIMGLEGFVALSGYANPIYDSFEWTDRHEWEVSESTSSQAFTEENNLTDKYMERGKRTEVLWIKEAK